MVDQANRQRQLKLAAACLVDDAALQARLEDMQFGLTYGAFKAEQQPVIEVTRVVDAVFIENQGLRQRRQFQQAVPVGVIACQPRDFQAEHDADMAVGHFRDQALETIYRDSPELRAAEVAVRHAEFSVRRAEIEKIPDIFVRGGLRNNREYGEIGPFGPIQRRGLEGIFDVSVQIPIFNRNQGGVKAAKAEGEHARLEVQRTRLALKARLAAEYKDYRDSSIAVERYRTLILPKARQAYDLYLANFRQMAGAYPQALIAQRNLFQFQDSYVAALVNTWQRAVEIQGLLLGGGTDLGMPMPMGRVQPTAGGGER